MPLADDEELELEARPHWKMLVPPVLVLIVTTGLASFLAAVLPGDTAAMGRLLVAAVAAVIVLGWTVRPFLRWRTTSFALTTRRIVTRRGILARRGRDVPLARVSDVSFSRTFPERLLGCGTIVIESAGEHGQLVLTDIPHVETVQAQLYRLLDEDARHLEEVDDSDEVSREGEE